MFRGLFFIIFITNIPTSLCVLDDLYEAGQQVWKLWTIIDNMGTDISQHAETPEQLNNSLIIREVKEKVNEIQQTFNQLEKLMGPKKIRKTIQSWPLNASTIQGIDTIEVFIQIIDDYYKQFNDYMNETHYSDHTSNEKLLEKIFVFLESDIGMIQKLVTNEGKSLSDENSVAVIADYVHFHSAEICGTPQVISNIMMQLFRMIIIAELKTSTMAAYENIYGYVKNKDEQEWQKINLMAREKLEKQFAIYINLFSSKMAMIDGVYNRACDPPGGKWTRDKSFYELEKTFQAIIFNYNSDNCGFTSCDTLLIRRNWRCPPLFSPEPVFRSPADTIAECAYLNHIKACVLKSGPYTYQYVNSTELGFLGRNSSCPKNNGQVIESISTWEVTYAACACNFNRSHNKISLLMIESDVDSNRVITGLRFVRKNEVLYIQPREGTLESNGYIRRYSQRWISIPQNIRSSLIEPINKNNGVFFLDDLTLPINYVLTGIKFKKVTRGDVSGFAIKILGRFFSYESSKLLSLGHFKRLTKESTEKSGKRLLFNRVSSVFTTLPHIVTSSDAKYVSLDRSTLREDFGQSTLPLFDAVPITFEVPSALGGVGIFHKGVEGYAGLISLRVYGINYKEYFNEFKELHIINDSVLFSSSN